MHFALSTMHLTLLSANMSALLEAVSVISFSPIWATVFGSNPENASLLVFDQPIHTINLKKMDD